MMISLFVVSLAGTAHSQRIDQTTLISLNETKRPLREVLDRFEQQGNVTFDVKWIGLREKTLSEEVTIKFTQKPFWKAMDLLMDAAGLRVSDFYRSTIVLKRKPAFPFLSESVPVANPITQGAFQARLEKHGMFNQLDVVIRPEPWVGQPYVVGYEATITFADGQSKTYKPKFLIWVYKVSDEVSLRIEMDDWPAGVAVHKVDLTAQLQIGQEWDQITLPPVSQMVPREIKALNGRIRIERTGFEKAPNAKWDEYGIKLRLEAVGLAKDEKLNELFALVSPEGISIDPHKTGVSGGETNKIKWTSVDLGFTPDRIEGEFEDYRLSISLEDGTQQVIGPIGEIAPKIADAGISQIAIPKAGLLTGETKLLGPGIRTREIKLLGYGIRIPWDRVQLNVGEDSLEPVGHGRGSGYPHQMTFDFETDDIQTPRNQWKLVVEAPTKSVDHTLTFSFDDVEMPKD